MKIPKLVGLPCILTRRAADLRGFHFGEKLESRDKWGISYRGNTIIHVQSFWRIVKGRKVLVSSNDLWVPNAKNPYSEIWDYSNGNRQETILKTIFTKYRRIDKSLYAHNLIVTKCKYHENKDLSITFNTGHILQIINDGTEELYRFIDVTSKKHIVVYGDR